MSKWIPLLWLAAILAGSAVYAKDSTVRVDGDEAAQFIGKLKKRGLKKGITFKIDLKKYDYRITVKSGYNPWANRGAKAQAAVFDNECELLFMLSREGRLTKGGALNALAKEVVKRLKIFSADSTDHGANRDADDPSQ